MKKVPNKIAGATVDLRFGFSWSHSVRAWLHRAFAVT
jgi:hypothetical protein